MSTDDIDASFRDAYRSKELLGATMDCAQERLMFVRDAFREHPPPAELGAYVLVLILGRGEWRPIRDKVLVGSDASCDLVLNRPGVSRRHCWLKPEDGDWEIHDCGSTNGTHLNEARVSSARLVSGDVLLIGQATLVYFERGQLP